MTFSSAPICTRLASGGGDGILAKSVEFLGRRSRDCWIVPREQPLARRHRLFVGSLEIHLRRQKPARYLDQMSVVQVRDDALEPWHKRLASGVELKRGNAPTSAIPDGVQRVLADPLTHATFVDADSDVEPDALTLEQHELEPGRDYHVIFSHVGGFYRCRRHCSRPGSGSVPPPCAASRE